MLRNVAVVGGRIVKVAQAHVKQKFKEAVRDATSRLPPEVLENEARLYSALKELEEVELWTRASRHMGVRFDEAQVIVHATCFFILHQLDNSY